MLSLVRHCLCIANIGINRLTVCHYLAVTCMDNLSLELPTPNFSSTINFKKEQERSKELKEIIQLQ